MTEPLRIGSRDNPWLKWLRKLAHGNTGYRDAKAVWIEGEHLCQAALQAGLTPSHMVCTDSVWEQTRPQHRLGRGAKCVLLPERLFAEISALESPAGLGLVLPIELHGRLLPGAASVVLDQVQDAGNVGSILRSAAAFGFTQVLALTGTAALWGPKVLRAGMGAHFALRLVESLEPGQLADLGVPLFATHPHHGEPLENCALTMPCAWVFGHEGQGVGDAVRRMATGSVRIEQPGVGESLNVAACAAICLYASAVQAARDHRPKAPKTPAAGTTKTG